MEAVVNDCCVSACSAHKMLMRAMKRLGYRMVSSDHEHASTLAGHKTGAACTSSIGHSNPRYATSGKTNAHRTPTAGAVRAESACGSPPAPLA